MQTEQDDQSFLKRNKAYCPYEDARVVIMQVPFEGTASFGKGTADGPGAIIRASEFLELYDMELSSEPFLVGISTLPPISVDSSPENVIGKVRDQAIELRRDGKTPVLIGGEHSVSYGAIQAARQQHPEVGVLQFDAHADLRDIYEDTPWSHACVMKRVLDAGVPYAGIGIRSICREESTLIQDRNLKVYPPTPLDKAASIIEALPEKIYITLDIDVLDPSCMPATGTPEPGGFSWNELVAILGLLPELKKEVVGFDVVELAPIHGVHFCEFTAAKLIYKMIGMFWGKQEG
ncbi:MAG: agmatinase [Kiritimatiellae bacterium]|nr:agmatinase [Kiritimatiellia bacterium]